MYGDYDKNGVYLRLNKDNIIVTSQKSNASEELKVENYLGVSDDFTCLVDIQMLKSILQNLTNEDVEIHYGQKSSILIKENNISYVLCLLEKNN